MVIKITFITTFRKTRIVLYQKKKKFGTLSELKLTIKIVA